MATVILVRHGRTTANATGVLAGRTPGVLLDETGEEQAAATGERLAVVPLAALVSSPLDRCRQTIEEIRRRQVAPPEVTVDEAISECDYGDWQGRPLAELAGEELWTTVQRHPSAAHFPGGESIHHMQSRSVAAIRAHDAAIEAEHGAGAVWVAVSHGDIIKAVVADAYGMHLDLFQRVQADPASVTIIRYGRSRPQVVSVNTHAGDLAWLAPTPGADAPDEDAAVGGGAGPAASPGGRS
ncbi:histidine phosphatase family protein [Aeromicrobium sp.]|uniref:histidine phosphatase family protein n=1 Tax=Aeromicrobium sp. TaxID=1871063 RepID=UPI0025C0935D|nr:histidine phosphatase family protein [Aeromicrobium sp.]MCK5891871.1 MSMEG_4193 family putative phosphomutase [Aeromicrobium sp.]